MRQYLKQCFFQNQSYFVKSLNPSFYVLRTYLRCLSLFISFVFHCRLLFPHKNIFSKWFVYVLRISFELLAVSALQQQRKKNWEKIKVKTLHSAFKTKDDKKVKNYWTKQSKLRNMNWKRVYKEESTIKRPSDGMTILKTASNFNFVRYCI